jgi:hypothetical protein
MGWRDGGMEGSEGGARHILDKPFRTSATKKAEAKPKERQLIDDVDEIG